MGIKCTRVICNNTRIDRLPRDWGDQISEGSDAEVYDSKIALVNCKKQFSHMGGSIGRSDSEPSCGWDGFAPTVLPPFPLSAVAVGRRPWRTVRGVD